MAVFEGVYKSLLQGVSQQTPQERSDGQLGEQINMLSDPVTGLRRRGGVKFHEQMPNISPNSYIKIIDISGIKRILAIDVSVGKLHVSNDFNASTRTWTTFTDTYFKAVNGKVSIRSTLARDKFYVVNTEKVPTLTTLPITPEDKNPKHYGYFSIRGSAFSKPFSMTVGYGTIFPERTVTVITDNDNAGNASPEWVAAQFITKLKALPQFDALFKVTSKATTVAIEVRDKTNTTEQLIVQSSTTGGYVLESGGSRIPTKADLLGVLPDALDGYILAVGTSTNTAYYKYSQSTRTWAESGEYALPTKIVNEPQYLEFNEAGVPALKTLGIKPRSAGNVENNPLPKFIDYGITGISAYQSRLVLLSGSYVNLSKTTDFSEFMRTSVVELLDDDAIEVSSAVLSSAQFEYAMPYNKDLVLISSGQQAVIPANSTVLTPKTAVIYPSTELDLSLAVEPVSISRTMYYTYQRGAEYYQVGEFIPNTYTEAQYYSQNLTDHIPLYAKGVCTTMAASSTNNMVIFCSDSPEVLVNQFMWQGEERPLMSFHKWILPYSVMYAQFIQEYLVFFMDDGVGGLVVGVLNVQLNQLDDKPVPYLDMYQYLDTEQPTVVPKFQPSQESVATIYDSRTARHKEVTYKIADGLVSSPYSGILAYGIRYNSTFTLTPPFIKDGQGKVITGARSTIQQLRFTFKNTGSFEVRVQDTMGEAYHGLNDTALTWSEVDLGYSWVNSIGTLVIPCRTRLSSTECTVSTTGTTDMNPVSTEYVLRIAQKRRRL